MTRDSIHFREPPKRVQPLGMEAAVVMQRLDRHIQPDLGRVHKSAKRGKTPALA